MGFDIKGLAIELPEDIMKAKWCGDFERAERLISLQLDDPHTPEFLKKRLITEKYIIEHLPMDYIYSEEEAFEIITKEIPDFKLEEFHKLIDISAIDWIYIKGRLTISRRFFETLCKVHRDIARRAGKNMDSDDKNDEVMRANILRMKKDGYADCRIKIKAKLKIKDEAFKEGELVRVYIPVPTECENMKNIKIISTSHEAKKLSDGTTGARTIMFEESPKENEEFFVEYQYNSQVHYNELDPEKVLKEQPKFETEELYPHIRFTPTIMALKDELVGGETNPLIIAKRFYDYCTKSVIYSFMREYLCFTEISEYVALGRKGDCGVQVLLFITLCRAAGIPARWQSGLFVTPNFCGSHDWVQFYIAPYGWLFADISIGGSAFRKGDLESHQFYFGNLDPFRMASNTRFQADFDPPMEHLRIDPYDSQRGEVDYPNQRSLLFYEINTEFDVEEIDYI